MMTLLIILLIYLVGLVMVYVFSVFLAKKFNFGLGLFGDQHLFYRSKKINSKTIILDSLLWPLIIGLIAIILFVDGITFFIKLFKFNKLFNIVLILFNYIINYFIKKTDNILKG